MGDVGAAFGRVMEKTGEQEEGQHLLLEYEASERATVTKSFAKRRRHQYQKFLFVLCSMLLAFATLSLLSYRYIITQSWKAFIRPEYASGGEKNDSLAIILQPELHRSRPPRVVEHNWTITSGVKSPDGVQKQVYLVNSETHALKNPMPLE